MGKSSREINQELTDLSENIEVSLKEAKNMTRQSTNNINKKKLDAASLQLLDLLELANSYKNKNVALQEDVIGRDNIIRDADGKISLLADKVKECQETIRLLKESKKAGSLNNKQITSKINELNDNSEADKTKALHQKQNIKYRKEWGGRWDEFLEGCGIIDEQKKTK